MTLSEELTARGFIHQFTAENLSEILDGEKQTIYHGIDPSADSAHAGNFVVWVLLRHLHKAGHRVIFLVGGGTGMIGDPKPDAERTLKSEDETDQNVEKLRHQASQVIGDKDILFVNNKDWLAKEGLLSFLRDIGKHFTVNELVKKDAIAKRLSGDTGISYTEFAYPLLQGFDYYVLNRDYNCNIQVGGSDQWGNIVAGVELIRRKAQKTVHAITVPLVTDKATGKKFGKSEGNAVWLDRNKTSPYQFYQFWLNTSDESVIDYLKLFTFLSLEEINEIETEHTSDKSLRIAQKRLADEVVRFVHGNDALEGVLLATAVLFGQKDLASLTPSEHALMLTEATIHHIPVDQTLVDSLIATGLAESKREARTFVADGAVALNETVVTDGDIITATLVEGVTILRRGKKNRVFVGK